MNNNNFYYSFKTFPQFWLAKSTRIIHHNHAVTDDQISKNFEFNEEMMSKMQSATG